MMTSIRKTDIEDNIAPISETVLLAVKDFDPMLS
jgi:hypothetical protein